MAETNTDCDETLLRFKLLPNLKSCSPAVFLKDFSATWWLGCQTFVQLSPANDVCTGLTGSDRTPVSCRDCGPPPPFFFVYSFCSQPNSRVYEETTQRSLSEKNKTTRSGDTWFLTVSTYFQTFRPTHTEQIQIKHNLNKSQTHIIGGFLLGHMTSDCFNPVSASNMKLFDLQQLWFKLNQMNVGRKAGAFAC